MYTFSPNLQRAIVQNILRCRQSKASESSNNTPGAENCVPPLIADMPPPHGQIMEFFEAKGGWESIRQPDENDDSDQIIVAKKMMRLASRVVELHLSQAAPPTQEQVDDIVLDLL